MKIEVYLEQHEWSASTRVYIVAIDASGRRSVAKPMELTFTPHEPGLMTEPSLTIGPDMGQGFLPALAEGLARAGYRQESTDAGELKATKYHLEDMRKISTELLDRGAL